MCYHVQGRNGKASQESQQALARSQFQEWHIGLREQEVSNLLYMTSDFQKVEPFLHTDCLAATSS